MSENNKLPNWAVKPKQKGVIATSRGWVLESTGEILKRVNDLPTKLKALMRELTGSLETIKEEERPFEQGVDGNLLNQDGTIFQSNTEAPEKTVEETSTEPDTTPEPSVEKTPEGSSDKSEEPNTEVAINKDEPNKKRRGRKPNSAKTLNETDKG